MDENFARSRGLPIIDTQEYRIELRFADGSTAHSSGITQGDAPSHVILSENYLLGETQAFTRYSDYLLDGYKQKEEEEEDQEGAYVFVVIKKARVQFKGQYNGVNQLCDDILQDEEWTRRKEDDYNISNIQEAAARGAAEATETLRRQQ
ncbi:hypothetical protein G6011_03743 [Alternaria panax]|uniref:Uncharacterized protein n=1 Tax=Alternaria panax TaxID=48097 RepID=A0AAD4IFX0_9PLEO|nr:hypothetical protein G6011_03743 [Alternaria panax]